MTISELENDITHLETAFGQIVAIGGTIPSRSIKSMRRCVKLASEHHTLRLEWDRLNFVLGRIQALTHCMEVYNAAGGGQP